MSPIYQVRLLFEWGGGCVWCGNEAALDRFGVGPLEEKFALSDSIRQELNAMTVWHDKSLNWDYPPDPGPWSTAEAEQFEKAALEMRARLQSELGPEFEVNYVRL